MKKFLLKVLVYAIISILGAMWFVGVLNIINTYVEWCCADNLRFIITSIIEIFIIMIMVTRELAR